MSSIRNKLLGLVFTLILYQYSFAQNMPAVDSLKTMDEIVITAFEQNRVVSNGTIIKVIDQNNADRNNKVSLVHAFNTVSGVRMEERSPGSYRLNIRGSSLRSPFGVRNVKVYWNDIPLTDAGGNTYFNQIAQNNFSSLEIIKGPAGSLYGAGTGGAILMHSLEKTWNPRLKFEYITGSFGLHNILTSVDFGNKRMHSQITYAHNQSDGYRDQTKSRKDNISFVTQFNISDKQQITASVLYNNLFYETPGGLNLAQFLTDPKQARPAAGIFPGAEENKAAIDQKNFTVGINHRYSFNAHLKNATTVFGTNNQISNPSIRNYERRNEPGFGGRTSFVYEKQIKSTHIQLVAGAELQQGFFNTQVFANKTGNPDTLQTNDDIQYTNSSFFTQADIRFHNNWIITAGVSMNRLKVNFKRLSVFPVLRQDRTYKNQLSPRLALQKKLGKNTTLFASIANGFSPPTSGELLPSTGVISTTLEAEKGTNYEFGGRVTTHNKKLILEATGFYFRLNDALVTRRDSSNADFFVNAGNTRQAGLEISADYSTVFRSGLLADMNIKTAYTLSDFRYGDFSKAETDFSGKLLPSVPSATISVLADLQFKKNIYINTTYYYASAVFLNDANSARADAYHLLGFRLSWKPKLKKQSGLHFYAGIDNLLDQSYSLGNDINAAAGRYYNAAPKRNFYAGISFQWNKLVAK